LETQVSAAIRIVGKTDFHDGNSALTGSGGRVTVCADVNTLTYANYDPSVTISAHPACDASGTPIIRLLLPSNF
jgi:hypothetical protein